MVVKYWIRTHDKGTNGPFQCDKSEIAQIMKHRPSNLMWIRVELPNGDKWFSARYVAGGKWVKLQR